jgi:hypothetical protein
MKFGEGRSLQGATALKAAISWFNGIPAFLLNACRQN